MSFCREWYLKSIGDYETLAKEKGESFNEIVLNDVEVNICKNILEKHGVHVEAYSDNELICIAKAMHDFADSMINLFNEKK